MIIILSKFNPWIKERTVFENKNHTDNFSRSFNRDDLCAAIAFEVSSEGELEQIYPLMDSYFKELKKVEILYSSKSVEKSIGKICNQYKNLVRIYRMPLLTFGLKGRDISKWVSAPLLVLCRYDFYPELMLLGMRKEMRFVLVSATLKNKSDNLISKFVYKTIYKTFDFIVCANKKDYLRFSSIGINESLLADYDFRTMRVRSRIENAYTTLRELPFYQDFNELITKYDKSSRVILGSAWPNEMEIFSDSTLLDKIINGELFITIAPHKLNRNFVIKIEQEIVNFSKVKIPIYEINKSHSKEDVHKICREFALNKGVLILLVPGILCEMYSLYSSVFVGGGHGRSIHSVLEPYVGFTKVYCGPKIHRSTEYDYILSNSKNNIFVVDKLSDFSKIYFENEDVPIDIEYRKKLFLSLDEGFKDVVTSINGLNIC